MLCAAAGVAARLAGHRGVLGRGGTRARAGARADQVLFQQVVVVVHHAQDGRVGGVAVLGVRRLRLGLLGGRLADVLLGRGAGDVVGVDVVPLVPGRLRGVDGAQDGGGAAVGGGAASRQKKKKS